MGDFDDGRELGLWGDDGIPNWIDNEEPELHEAQSIEQKKEEPDTTKTDKKAPKIAIFGVGTAGCNLIDILAESDISDKVKLVVVDNEADGVKSHNADVKIAMYKEHPPSLHQPWTPQRGKDGALEVYDEIIKAMK